MRRKNKLFSNGWLVIALLVFTGCAVNKNSFTPFNESLVTLPIVFQYEGLPVAEPYIDDDEEGFVIQILKGGGKIVTNDKVPSLLIEPTKNREFVLDLEKIHHLTKSAMRTLDVASNPLVTVFPESTNIQRIGIYTHDRFLQEHGFHRDVGYTRLNDELSGDDLIILAVDRACTIKGRLTASEEMEDINVELKGAGLHLLKMVRSPGERPKLIVAENVRPRLIVDFYKTYVAWLESNPSSMKSNRKLPVLRAGY